MTSRTSSRVSKTLAFSSLALLASTGCEDEEAPEPSQAFPLGAVSFVEVTDQAGLDAPHGFSPEATKEAGPLAALLTLVGGAALADVDGDHHDDVLLLGGDAGARFYFNAGDGSFDEATELVELELDPFSTAPLLVDVDADLYPDLLVANVLTGAVELWRNLEGERFERDAEAFGAAAYGADGALAPATGLAVADVDFDGDLDVFVARWNVFEDDESRAGLLWVNDGEGRFSDASGAITEALGRGDCRKMLGAYLSPSFANVRDIGDNANIGRDLVIARQDGPSVVLDNRSTDHSLSFEQVKFDDLFDEDLEDLDVAPGMLGSSYDGVFWSNSYWSQFGIGGVRVVGLLGDESLGPTAADEPRELSPEAKECRPSQSEESIDGGPSGSGTSDAGVEAGIAMSDSVSASLGIAFQDAENRMVLLSDPEKPWTLSSGPAIGGCSADFDNNGLIDQLRVIASMTAEDSDDLPNSMRLFLASRTDEGLALQEGSEASELESTEDGRSALCFDYDSDGDVDVLLTSQGGAAQLFRNDVVSPERQDSRFIGVRLEPSEDLPIPTGSLVVISTNTGRTASISLQVNSGFLAQAPLQAHFGLRDDEEVELLMIAWPDGAPTSAFEEVPANDIYRIKRTASTAE